MAGSNPALVVRVAASIEELRKNLQDGTSTINTTTAGMQKLAASFTGDKLIQSAQNVTAAIQSIGGASKLTDAEAARVNATLEKALQKYEALGREAPAGMRQLADETKRVDTASSGLTDTVKDLALGFVAMFTVRAAFDFVKNTINEASALKDLSTETHINVEELQLLAGAMSEFGVDADTLGKGLYKLSRGIAGGDESVATGLHLMGMSLKDVEGLQGKELFLKIESGLATLQGGLRDTAAAELFGGKLGAAMAGASEGIEGAMATWQKLNHVASTESVDAMDTFGESIARANKNISSIAANMIGPLAQGFNVLNDAVNKGASKWSIFWAMTLDALDVSESFWGSTTRLTKVLNDQAVAEEHAAAATRKGTEAHTQHTAAVDTRTAAEKFMAALEADSAVALTAAQLTDLEHLKEIGALNAKNAAAIGVNADQFKRYEEGVAAAKKYAEALVELNATGVGWRGTLDTIDGEVVEAIKYYLAAGVAQDKLATAYGLTAVQVAAINTSFTDHVKSLDAVAAAMKSAEATMIEGWNEVYKAEEAVRDRELRLSLSWMDQSAAETEFQVIKAKEAASNRIAQSKLTGEAYTAFEKLVRAELDETVAHLRGFKSEWDVATESMKATNVTLIGGATEVGTATEDAAKKCRDGYSIAFHDAGGGFAAFKGAVLQGNEEMIASTFGLASAYAAVLNPIGTPKAVGGQRVATSADVAAVGSSGFRAAGGPVASGAAYVVGERGPELFVPDRAGSIVPNGGGIIINAPITINGSVLSGKRELAAAVGDALMTSLRASGMRLPSR
jgi:hypothetical protein